MLILLKIFWLKSFCDHNINNWDSDKNFTFNSFTVFEFFNKSKKTLMYAHLPDYAQFVLLV